MATLYPFTANDVTDAFAVLDNTLFDKAREADAVSYTHLTLPTTPYV